MQLQDHVSQSVRGLGKLLIGTLLAVVFAIGPASDLFTTLVSAETENVTFEYPTHGSTVWGPIVVKVSTTYTNVEKMELYIDGTSNPPRGVDTTAPYEFPWDTTTETHGTHQLGVRVFLKPGDITGGTVFKGISVHVTPPPQPPTSRTFGDYNGDGKTDVAVYRPSTGGWFILGQPSPVWGATGDIPVPGDYNGDGKTDVAIFRPSNGGWLVRGGDPSFVSWGTNGDVPVPADYNGDGKTDVAVYRPSTRQWYLTLPTGQTVLNWGAAGDIPVPGDYNGDDKADIAVYRPSTGGWFILGQPSPVWGATGDIPVPGDYNGDGKTDVAIFRPSNGGWLVRGGDPSFVSWGTNGDVPVPADYNGDGKADIAVYRPSNGGWFIKNGNPGFASWGTTGDVPLSLPWSIYDPFF